MKQVSLRVVLLVCVLLGAFASQALAQEATIVGSVTDQTGLAIPNATVTIVNSDTGQSQVISSNSLGQFVVPALHIGSYSVNAEAQGGKTWTPTGRAPRGGGRSRL